MDESTTTSPRGTTRYASESYALSGKIMLSAIVILFTVVLLILCLHVYARCFLSRRRRRGRRRPRPRIIFAADLSPNPTAGRGLDPSILSSLPTFPFSSFSSHHPDDEGLDCAVCLSEFRPSDTARFLPKCGHAFHVDCIDMWFHSHDTCPLCRLPVRAAAFDNDQLIQVVIHTSEDNNNNSNNNNDDDDDDGAAPSSSSSSSSSSTHSVVGKKGMMRIEVPKRNNESFFKVDHEESSGSPGNLMRTPGGGRILSIKRILGRERSWRQGASNSTTTTPLSCTCRSATTVMDEEGQDQERQSSSSSSSSHESSHQSSTPSAVKA
ncbi:hypothetical protein Scep_008990 [Stephania cephalantha]|uniref:RING-type E3 ubiquitin transferase n=1 Tax=Stephania cephalantha TaxID=152367 RepID=A0AAP0JT17_9MAGN